MLVPDRNCLHAGATMNFCMDAGNAIRSRWFWIPIRVLLLSFLLSLLAFAGSLLLGIVGVVILGWIRHTEPNMTLAYRNVAVPSAILAGIAALISFAFIEVRRYRQARALAAIERSSSSPVTFSNR